MLQYQGSWGSAVCFLNGGRLHVGAGGCPLQSDGARGEQFPAPLFVSDPASGEWGGGKRGIGAGASSV